ncbi:unnamed protein product (macronuclear) [Paramecium tetraurelia]|uniref:Uncharacterized protein n=1 Tax=Paramecium tetraurelia TaxID=5888 RepID=A0BP87_PARTE|nr:uncharacterized protein GSPATT00005103001 [Paramecium tetraurelia]CAK60354.1 unnamed protein product [Paramecium tetraurelia]|eukprot:XP_001427752.1 hypothetical protein (macronuclear) [Paramecium tetraurelia strain d4-2]
MQNRKISESDNNKTKFNWIINFDKIGDCQRVTTINPYIMKNLNTSEINQDQRFNSLTRKTQVINFQSLRILYNNQIMICDTANIEIFKVNSNVRLMNILGFKN